MLIGTFLIYFFLFVYLFSSPAIRNKHKSKGLLLIFILPAFLGLLMVMLSVLKVYFFYKLLLLLFSVVIFYLTYLEWGRKFIRKKPN